MFNAISWSEYLTTVFFLLAIYYAVIGYRFFRDDLLRLAGIKRIQSSHFAAGSLQEAERSFQTFNERDYMPKPDEEIDLTPIIVSFQDETSAYLQEAAANNIIKQEVLYALETIASKYAVLGNADCRSDLLHALFQQANTLMPGAFGPGDFKKLFLSK